MKLFVSLFFIALLVSCISNPTETTILKIQPYKGFSTAETDTIAKAIKNFYHVNVVISPKIDLPKNAFVTIKSARFRADTIIKFQKTILDTADYCLGLTHKDISITKYDGLGNIKSPEWKYNDFGIMGLAYCPGNSAIVSSFRLKNKNETLYLIRLKKIVVHEFGHSLGLPHCSDKNCVMTDASEKMSTIDNAKYALCDKCKKKLGQ
ncbi:MAG: matrixin family metalloprotease [Flavobacterium sp.]|nr:matrixin family metalloprotease [Flavobacterium sp.]